MGIFRKMGNWLTEKSDRFIRGEADTGYYATRDAEQAYAMGNDMPAMDEENATEEEAAVRQPLDPFGHGKSRQVYRSRYDQEREAQQQMQAQPAAQPQYAQQPAAQQQPVKQAAYVQPQASNVVPFPGMQRSPEGSLYAHVEYIVLLRNRNECKDVIAYIKTNASVFLNMEFIASDNERQRCVDMLSGAAYTLGCALNRISPRGIYLISSPSVRVVLDPAMQKFASTTEQQGFVRQRYEAEGRTYQERPAEQEQPTAHQQPVSAFSTGSPTTRFQAQGTQRMPTSFGSVMAGNATGIYQPVQPTGHYAAVQQ